jgi:putative SbcD/Mre11-related phosphoesterase
MQVEIAPGAWLNGQLALWLKPEATLVVADLHWGYARSHRARGNLVPLWGDTEIETRLNFLLKQYQPQRLVWLGDSLHTLSGRAQAESFLDALSPHLEVCVLAGNHDRTWTRVTARTLRVGNYFLHHGDNVERVPRGAVELVGHFHPAVTWRDGAGLNLKLPALVQGKRRWIMPAFSPWAEGTDWTGFKKPREMLWSISPKRIFPWQAQTF